MVILFKGKKEDDDKKKGHIQPCDVGGSLYGHKSVLKKAPKVHNQKVETDYVKRYNEMYKKQVNAWSKLLNRDKK